MREIARDPVARGTSLLSRGLLPTASRRTTGAPKREAVAACAVLVGREDERRFATDA